MALKRPISSQGKMSMHEFVQLVLSSNGKGVQQRRDTTFHFFEQEYTFSCFEYQALFIADEYYHTRYSVRIEYGLESLSLSKKFFKKVCHHLLSQYEVCVWGKRSKELNSPYEMLASGGPGNIRAISDILGGFTETDSVGDYVAVLYADLTTTHQLSFSLAYFNDSDYHLSVIVFRDDSNFSKLRSMVSQYGIRDCLLLNVEAALKKSTKIREVENIDLVNDVDGNRDNNANETSPEFNSYQQLQHLLENELNIFVDSIELHPINSDKDKHAVLAEIADIIDPLSFQGPVGEVRASGLQEDSEIQRVQRLREIDESFGNNNGAMLVALAALRRQQRIEKLRFNDDASKSSMSCQIPISFSVKSDDEESNQILLLDQATISSLQLLPSDNSSSLSAIASSNKRTAQSTLFRLLDRTCTSMGRRLLRTWIQRPSAHLPTILARQQCVQFFMQNSRILATIRESSDHFRNFPDLDKLLQKLRPFPTISGISATGNRELRDLLELYKCIVRSKAVCGELTQSTNTQTSHQASAEPAPLAMTYVTQLGEYLEQCSPFLLLVEEIIDADHLQASYAKSKSDASRSRHGEGLFRARFLRIKPNLSPELESSHVNLEASIRDILSHFSSLPNIVGVDAKELHLELSPVHGIHLRVTKRLSSKVLKSLDSQKIVYRVISQQKAGVLFLTRELENLLQKYEQRKQLYESHQLSIVLEAMKVARTYVGILQSAANKLAALDALMSMASVSLTYDWVIPTMYDPSVKGIDKVCLEGLYHPLLREQLGSNQVVVSDIELLSPCLSRNIFGPNMGGKSTFLKAVGTVIVLAQLGSAVPCRKSCIPVLERLFLRTGAAESAALGMSSFLAEMNSMSELLRLASSRSLVLIDEIGRGTSTSDGFGLAWAILEDLVVEKRAVVLCATHFHELAQMENIRDAENCAVFGSLHVDAIVDTETREIRMLYKVLGGSSNRSYGVHCAKVAGFPEEIVTNALAIEFNLENRQNVTERREENSSSLILESRKRSFESAFENAIDA